MTRVHYYFPPGYGLHVLGLVIPFPPAWVLWAMAALDVALTLWVWRAPRRWPILLVAFLMTAYLTVVGLFSIGVLYLILLVFQFVRLLTVIPRVGRRYRRRRRLV